MKIDLINHFIEIHRKMGIPEDYKIMSGFENDFDWIKLEKEGIEIDINDIDIDDKGLFSYYGKRVVVYIRDVFQYGSTEEYNLPKFHIAFCKTLEGMKNNGRYEVRYVVRSGSDNNFLIKKIKNNEVIYEAYEELKVCKNCLRKLNYNGYNFKNDKNEIFSRFSLEEFFSRYAVEELNVTPLHTPQSAPINAYPENWEQISYNYREKVKWKCEKCGLDFINNKKSLHVHHKNGDKSDIRESNLQALCDTCHKKEPLHEHMRRKFK